MYMRRELEQSKHNNGVLLESNANLQVEIDSMNNHIRVVSHQNDELTREIDQFVHANEMIRQKLDRKPRVDEIRHRNDQELMKSQNYVLQKSCSPTRGTR
jgi:peptidoglycan hydrolase CwlO-like protein